MHNFSPELVLLWARRTVLYLELEFFEQQVEILEAKKKQDDGKIDSNQLMSNDEMLWASPSVILDYLQRLGTLQG